MRPRVTGGLDAPPCHARKRYCHSVAIAAQQRRARQLPASWAISRIGEDMQLFSCVISENSTQVDCGLSEREEIRVIPSGSCRQRNAFNCSVPGCGRGSRPCPQVTAACRASPAARPPRRRERRDCHAVASVASISALSAARATRRTAPPGRGRGSLAGLRFDAPRRAPRHRGDRGGGNGGATATPWPEARPSPINSDFRPSE
jgi:hypothetical protein